MFPYKHVMAFLSKAETTYIFPTELKPIFKIKKLKIVDNVAEKPLYWRTNGTHWIIKIFHLRGKNRIFEGSLEMDSQWVCRVSV